MDGLKRYVNDDRFRVDGDKNMRLLAFAFTIVFVWTGPKSNNRGSRLSNKKKRLVCSGNMIQSRVNANLENCPFSQLVELETE